MAFWAVPLETVRKGELSESRPAGAEATSLRMPRGTPKTSAQNSDSPTTTAKGADPGEPESVGPGQGRQGSRDPLETKQASVPYSETLQEETCPLSVKLRAPQAPTLSFPGGRQALTPRLQPQSHLPICTQLLLKVL